jgi:hypothetical protein
MEIKLADDSVEEFIGSLEKQTIARVLHTIDLLETFGNKLGMPHSKMIQKDLFELRIRGKQEVRILYTFSKRNAVLLFGFVKKTEKTPRRYIELALLKTKQLD